MCNKPARVDNVDIRDRALERVFDWFIDQPVEQDNLWLDFGQFAYMLLSPDRREAVRKHVGGEVHGTPDNKEIVAATARWKLGGRHFLEFDRKSWEIDRLTAANDYGYHLPCPRLALENISIIITSNQHMREWCRLFEQTPLDITKMYVIDMGIHSYSSSGRRLYNEYTWQLNSITALNFMSVMLEKTTTDYHTWESFSRDCLCIGMMQCSQTQGFSIEEAKLWATIAYKTMSSEKTRKTSLYWTFTDFKAIVYHALKQKGTACADFMSEFLKMLSQDKDWCGDMRFFAEQAIRVFRNPTQLHRDGETNWWNIHIDCMIMRGDDISEEAIAVLDVFEHYGFSKRSIVMDSFSKTEVALLNNID